MSQKIKATEVVVGDTLCEGSSGFMWKVTAIRTTGKMIAFDVSPVHRTMLREKAHTFRVRCTSYVMKAEQ